MDTSIDCESSIYKSFRVVDGLFIFVYMSIPFVWLVLLARKHKRLAVENDPASELDLQEHLAKRNSDPELQPLAFLFIVYQPNFYSFEIFEMVSSFFFSCALRSCLPFSWRFGASA